VRVVPSELFLLDHVIVTLVSMDHVSEISSTIEVVAINILGFFIHVASLVGLHDKLLEAEFVLK